MSASGLSEDFWAARKALTHIRRAAHAKRRSGDVALHVVFARLSSMLSHEVALDAGLGPASLNYFTAVIAPSGKGKTTGTAVGIDLLPSVPPFLATLDEMAPAPGLPGAWLPPGTLRYQDNMPLGTGEGLAELFMGVARVKTGENDKNGEPKWDKARAQVRHNAFVVIDEGKTLSAQAERKGTVIGPTLRSAWVGETLGQANAQEVTTRVIRRRSYALGLVAGYQVDAAEDLLAEVELGTPQRFGWASAADLSIPDLRPDDPGPLGLDLTWGGLAGTPWTGTVQYAAPIVAELDARELANGRGLLPPGDPLDSHETLMRMKISALLAVLDGRWSVDEEDWQLASAVWAASCGTRNRVLDAAREKATEAEQASRRRAADRVADAEYAKELVAQRVAEAAPLRIARWIASRVVSEQGATAGEVRKALAGRDRRHWDAALSIAIDAMWVQHEGDYLYVGRRGVDD